MAHSLSAKKRIRQNAKNKARNRWRLKSMRDAVREFVDKIAHGTEAEATESFRKVSKIVDRSTAKGIIHKNQGARRKSRMSKRLKAKFTAGAAGVSEVAMTCCNVYNLAVVSGGEAIAIAAPSAAALSSSLCRATSELT